MSSQVPWKRTNPRYQEILVGAPVRGRLWREMALLGHWIRGHGMQIIPAHYPGVELAPSASETFHYHVEPSGMAIARVWSIVLRSEYPRGARVTVTYPDGGSVVYTPPDGTVTWGESTARRVYVEDLAAKSSALTDPAITIANGTGAVSVFVESISCFELPRFALAQDATDLGVDVETLRAGQKIYDVANRSMHAVAELANAAVCRRSLAQLWFPTVQVTSASYVDVFVLPVPILPRKVYATDETAFVQWDVYARASDGTTKGDIQISTSGSFVTDSVSVDGTLGHTSFAFRADRSIEVNCEDLSQVDGLPAAGAETFQIAMRRTSGSGNVELRGVEVWEAAA